MSKSHYLFACLLCVFLVFVNRGSALSCYQCNSHDNSDCFTPEPSFKTPCPQSVSGKKYTLCRKIKQIIEFEVNGLPPDTRIIRSCGWDDTSYKNSCYQRSGFGGRQEVCACETDDCNAGSLTSPALALPVLLLATLAIKLFM